MANPRVQLRRLKAAQWLQTDPVLLRGEPGVETDTGQMKVGDGNTQWTELDYVGGVGANAHEGSLYMYSDDEFIIPASSSRTIWFGDVNNPREEGDDFYPPTDETFYDFVAGDVGSKINTFPYFVQFQRAGLYAVSFSAGFNVAADVRRLCTVRLLSGNATQFFGMNLLSVGHNAVAGIEGIYAKAWGSFVNESTSPVNVFNHELVIEPITLY